MRKCIICQVQLKKQKTYCSRSCLRVGYTGRKHSDEALSKMRGRKLSSETIEKQNASKSRERVRVEGDFSCEKCLKKFTSNTSLRSHMSYCSIADVSQMSARCQICDMLFKSNRSLLIHSSLKHASADHAEARRAKMIEAKKHCSFRRSSDAEDKFFEQVRGVFPDAVRDFMIPGYSHVYDVFVPSTNTIIEFDGDFWHGNKRLYELSDRMKRQFRLDQTNSANAISAGYKIIRVWHSESSEFIDGLKRQHDNT